MSTSGTPYVRKVPDCWEKHESYIQYMKMYCNFSREQAIQWAYQYLGPRPATVTITPLVITVDDEPEL